MTANPWANLMVAGVGALWGLYWAPLRQLDTVASAGPWATVAAVLVACVALAPIAWRRRGQLCTQSVRGLLHLGLGGLSFVLYSNGLLYGQVAVVILLFYLTPIWSTLIGRFWLGWPVSWWRYAAIGCGLMGIAAVLQGAHGGIPLPSTLGDAFGLASGMVWAVASTGIHLHARIRPGEATFIFCLGALVSALVIAAWLAPTTGPPQSPGRIAAASGWALLIGGLWWTASLIGFLWATRTLEPARVGMLLMSEVVVGAASAAAFADEPFGLTVAIGGVLVTVAGVLETWPDWPTARGRSSGPRED